MVYPCLPHVSIAINRGPKTPSFLEELTLWHHHTQLDTIDFTTLWMVYICDIMISYIYTHIHIYCNIFVLSPYGWPGATMRLTVSPCASTKLSRLPFPAWTAISKTISGHSQPLHTVQCGPSFPLWMNQKYVGMSPCWRDQHRSTTVITYKNHPLFLFFHRSGCRSSLHLALLWGKHWFSGGERIWQDY